MRTSGPVWKSRTAIAVLLLPTASACSSAPSVEVVEGRPGAAAYDGPLWLRVADPDSTDPLERSGAAGKALQCDGVVANGGLVDPGSAETGDSPVDALHKFVSDDPRALPHTGYHVEAEEGRRALLSYDRGKRTRVAVIVVRQDGSETSQQRWAVETFATCDPAEFHPSADADLGLSVWTDRDGRRVPANTIHSSPGSEHCDWETVTFLTLRDRQFVRDAEGVLAKQGISVVGRYDADAMLPRDATDTGYRLGKQQLWAAADGDSVYLVAGGQVQRWPRLREPTYCR